MQSSLRKESGKASPSSDIEDARYEGYIPYSGDIRDTRRLRSEYEAGMGSGVAVSDAQYMQNLGAQIPNENTRKMHRDALNETAAVEVAHNKARSTRQRRVAREYKGVR